MGDLCVIENVSPYGTIFFCDSSQEALVCGWNSYILVFQLGVGISSVIIGTLVSLSSVPATSYGGRMKQTRGTTAEQQLSISIYL